MGPVNAKKGYRIQFCSHPLCFNGVLPTMVGWLWNKRLLVKGAIERVPPPERASGFYSQYFIVSKKDGGLCPILDLSHLNRTVKKLTFKMI